MFGNGFRIAGIRITRGYPKGGQDRCTNATSARECCVGGLGSTQPEIFVQRIATETYQSTGMLPWVFGWLVCSTDTEVGASRAADAHLFMRKRYEDAVCGVTRGRKI